MKKIYVVVGLALTMNAFSQDDGKKWSTLGNELGQEEGSGDRVSNKPQFLGSTNAYPLIFRTNNVQQMSLGVNGAFQLNSLIGTGNRLLQSDTAGNVSPLIMGLNTQYLTGDGTWKMFPPIPPFLWVQSGTNSINYNGYVGINNSNPTMALDIIGDVQISHDLYVGAGIVIGKRVNTSFLQADTIKASPAGTSIAIADHINAIRDVNVGGKINSIGDINVGSALSVAGNAIFSGGVDAQNITFKGTTAGMGYVLPGNPIPTATLNAGNLILAANTNVWGNLDASSISIAGGRAHISYTPGGTGLGNANILSFGGAGVNSDPPCLPFAPGSSIFQFPGTDAAIQIASNSNTAQLTMGYDGANHFLEGLSTVGAKPGLLLNYYCGNDVYIGTGTTGGGNNINGGGVVQTGGNLEVGSPTRNIQIALNLISKSTIAMNLANTSNTSIFSVLTNGSVIAPSLPTGTASTPYYGLLVDGSGNIVKASSSVTGSSAAWVLGLNTIGSIAPAHATQYFGTIDNGDISIQSNSTEILHINAASNSPISHGINSIAINSGTQFLLNGNWDPNHGLGVFGNTASSSFASISNINGPVLYGFDGGALGTNRLISGTTTQNIALRWNAFSQVSIGPLKPLNYTNGNWSPFLSVNGTIYAQEIWVLDQPTGGWADYVFKKDYKLMPLNELEKYINQNKHLPNLPCAKEVESKGQNLGDLQVKQMEKIEELTLYAIETNKEFETLKKEKKQEMEEFKKEMRELKEEVKTLQKENTELKKKVNSRAK